VKQSSKTLQYYKITEPLIDEIKKSSGLSASDLSMEDKEFRKFISSKLQSSISIIITNNYIKKKYKPFPDGLKYITKQLSLNMMYRDDVMQMGSTYDTEKGTVRDWTPSIFTEEIQMLLSKYSRTTFSALDFKGDDVAGGT
jgi:predicted house-cleaning noncanonical NTP pyrophosphatase (MazG superfamily)